MWPRILAFFIVFSCYFTELMECPSSKFFRVSGLVDLCSTTRLSHIVCNMFVYCYFYFNQVQFCTTWALVNFDCFNLE